MMLIRLVIIFILFAACSNKSSNDSAAVKENAETMLPKSMIGKWKINETTSDGLSSVCNYCPSFIFEGGRKGSLVSTTGKVHQVNWDFKAPDTLSLNLLNDEAKTVLSCEQLVFKVELNKDSTTMQLTAFSGSCAYSLSREK